MGRLIRIGIRSWLGWICRSIRMCSSRWRLPGAVDVVASVPSGSGVLLSASPTEVGSESLVVATGYTSGSAAPRITGSPIYVQGMVQGDDVDDDVPVTIEVFYAGTTDPVGFEQADMPSVVDVRPSGFSFNTSNDLLTTTFSPLEEVRVQSICVARQRVRHAAQASAALSNSGAAIALRLVSLTATLWLV